jgi:hypothetical protein
MAHLAYHREQVRTASGLDILAGIWLLISPFVLGFETSQATTNNVILGIAIGVLAAIRFSGAYSASWISWINVVLGIWVLLSPWILGFSWVPESMTNNVIVGILVILLAGWSALASDTPERPGYAGPNEPHPGI